MPRKKNPHSTPYVKPDYHSQNKKQMNDTTNNDEPKKKIKLRSSLDIYNRLIHDKTLNIDLNKVKIGYTDHVLGDQEMCILDWVMIDKGGDIPMHHILYFVLILPNGNKIILWDRKIKLDRLYCSGYTNKSTQSLQYILQFQQNIAHKAIDCKTDNEQNIKIEIDSFIDYNKPTIGFDIDATIVDIEERLALTQSNGQKQIIDDEIYKYDRVIPVALGYLKYIATKYNILYLSGRNHKRIKESMKWLFNINQYPKGYIIHKTKRSNYLTFKQKELNKLKTKLNIIAYFGDTMIDCIASINEGIRPIIVVPNQWLFTKHIFGGMESVINDLKNAKSSHIDIAKSSKFWGMSYKDLIPIQFATELFDNQNKNILPPQVLLQCKHDENYWDNILKESNAILKHHQNQNVEENEEKKQIDNMQITKIPKYIGIDNDIINKIFPRYPTTNDGFVVSFNVNDTDKWMKYLDYYGLVVLKILNPNQANKTIDSMFDELYERTLELQENNDRKIYRVDINNPFTWNSFNFPKPYGKFLTDRPAFSKQAFLNRTSKKMHFVWSTIFGDKKLNCTIENWGIQRGTANLEFIHPETNKKMVNCHLKEQIKWRRNLRAHWDINPWSYIENLQSGNYKYLYQGALALSQQRMIDGTHLTLPGCTRFLKKWCDQNKTENINPFRHNISLDDDMIKYMQPIPLRKGEMVIWNMGQLHGNTKNMSNRMRLSQYMRMLPAQSKYIKRDQRSVQQQMEKYKNDIDIRKIIGDDIDDTMSKLLGLKEWD